MTNLAIKMPAVGSSFHDALESIGNFRSDYFSHLKSMEPFFREIKEQRERMTKFIAPVMEEFRVSSKIFEDTKKSLEEESKTIAEFLKPNITDFKSLSVSGQKTIPVSIGLEYSRIHPADIDFIIEKVSAQIHTKYQKARTSYHLPEGATWEGLRVKKFDGHILKVRYKDIPTETFDFKDMGFENRNTHNPDVKWKFLMEICEFSSVSNSRFNKQFGKNTKYEVAVRLKRFFNMKDDPFHVYKKSEGYIPKFAVITESSGMPFDAESSFDSEDL